LTPTLQYYLRSCSDFNLNPSGSNKITNNKRFW
jgi:hypothetical protein